jgi:cell division protein FtsQ
MLDFRNPKRSTLRLRPQALVGLKEIKGISFLELGNE